MSVHRCLRAVIAAAVVLIPAVSVGQQGDGAPVVPKAPSSSGERQNVPSVFGTQTNILQIPAPDFVPRVSTLTWSYGTDGYIYATNNPIGDHIAFWAPVTLPSGVNISYLDLYADDTDAANNVTATLRAYYGGDHAGNPTGFTDIDTISSSGSGGPGYFFHLFAISHTVNNDVAYNGGYQYTVVITLPAAPTSALRFKGVDIWWNRQVTPGPAVATFADVPTSSPQFKFVEALVSAGITAGCGSGNYCPNNPVTRGQMAVFLAQSLGLHYSH